MITSECKMKTVSLIKMCNIYKLALQPSDQLSHLSIHAHACTHTHIFVHILGQPMGQRFSVMLIPSNCYKTWKVIFDDVIFNFVNHLTISV